MANTMQSLTKSNGYLKGRVKFLTSEVRALKKEVERLQKLVPVKSPELVVIENILEVEQLREIIKASNNVVFFGGAGVSTASGIPDFRSKGGVYSKTNEIALSKAFYENHTEEFFKLYRENLLYPDAEPNSAHEALAELERVGKLRAVVTQNIDGLHQQAGSINVIELHGSVHRNYCSENHNHSMYYVLSADGIPECTICGEKLKPAITLYGESLDLGAMGRAIDFIRNADVLIVGGTSLTVHPAVGLLSYYEGTKLVIINKTQTPLDSQANLIIRQDIGDVLKSIL